MYNLVMNKIKTLALVAPSGNIRDYEDINNKIEILKKYFNVKKFYDENVSYNYLSDSDENRAKYFEQAFLDDEVDIVLSIRGGYGAIRIVDKIDYNKIKNQNKIYLGSSDATILLCALSKNTNIKCFHSLMMTNGFVENIEKNIEIINSERFDINFDTIKKGNLKGKLWGGNLSSLVSLMSDDSFIPDDDIILFVEDLNEPLYKIDKMLFEIYRNKQLKNKIKGIIFGDFYLDDNEIMPLLKEYSEFFNVPAVVTKDITHKMNNVTIPFMKYTDINAF